MDHRADTNYRAVHRGSGESRSNGQPAENLTAKYSARVCNFMVCTSDMRNPGRIHAASDDAPSRKILYGITGSMR